MLHAPSIPSIRCLIATLLFFSSAAFAPRAFACDPDHIESVTITDPIDIAQGGTGKATVTVTCVMTGSDLQAGDWQFDTRLVDDDTIDTTLSTFTYRAPGPKTDRELARAVYSFSTTLSCPTQSIKSGNVDTGEGAPDATPCSSPADLWIEIDEGSNGEDANYGDGHTTTRWPGDDVTTGLQADACCVPVQTSAATSTVLDEVAHEYLLGTADQLVFCDGAAAALGEESVGQRGARCGDSGQSRRSYDPRMRSRVALPRAGVYSLHESMRGQCPGECGYRMAHVRGIRGYLDLAAQTPWQRYMRLKPRITSCCSSLSEEGAGQETPIGTITIEGEAPFLTVTGPILADGTFTATANGNFMFLQGVDVEFVGRLVAGRLRGVYTIGPGNTLPMNMQLDFDVSLSFEEWDEFWQAAGSRLVAAGRELSRLSLPASVGGVNVSEFTTNLGSQLILAGHGVAATLDDDEIPVLPDGAPAVTALDEARAELEAWADAAAGSSVPNATSLADHLRATAALFGEASVAQAAVNAQRAGPLTDEVMVPIDDLLFALDRSATALAELSGLLFGSLVTTVSAADFQGPATAAEAIVSGFGVDLANALEVATQVPLPTELGGSSIRVTDSLGESRLAGLFFGSGGQINYLIPEGTAPGVALVTVFSGDQVIATGRVFVQAAAPSLFSANADGAGVAAAVALRIAADGTRTTENIFSDAPAGSRTAVPIAFGPQGERLFLLLFGTGVRGGQQIQVLVDGVEVPVLGFAASGEFVGLDQINVELLVELAGRGEVEIEVIVDGISANKVTMNLG